MSSAEQQGVATDEQGLVAESALSVDLGPDAVGLRFETPERVVEQRDVQLFAALTGDCHPQHLDERWATTSPFGAPIAHGLLVVSLAMGLVPVDPRRVVALRHCDATFKRPVAFGERIHVEGTLLAVSEVDKHHVLASWRWRIITSAGLLAVRLGVDVLWCNLDETAADPSVLRVPGVVPL